MHERVRSALMTLEDFDGSANEFYQQWWSGLKIDHSHPTYSTPSLTEFHSPIPVILSSDSSERESASDGMQMLKFFKGEILDSGNGFGQLIRRKRWETDFWTWRSTSSPENQKLDGRTIRIYVPSVRNSNDLLIDSVFEVIEGSKLIATLKQRRSSGQASDSMVLWVPEYQCSRLLRLLDSMKLTFAAKPPPLTFEYEGFGLADHPEDGKSLGMLFSDFLWGFVKGAYCGTLEKEAEKLGLSLDEPWVLDGRASDGEWQRRVL